MRRLLRAAGALLAFFRAMFWGSDGVRELARGARRSVVRGISGNNDAGEGGTTFEGKEKKVVEKHSYGYVARSQHE